MISSIRNAKLMRIETLENVETEVKYEVYIFKGNRT